MSAVGSRKFVDAPRPSSIGNGPPPISPTLAKEERSHTATSIYLLFSLRTG